MGLLVKTEFLFSVEVSESIDDQVLKDEKKMAFLMSQLKYRCIFSKPKAGFPFFWVLLTQI